MKYGTPIIVLSVIIIITTFSGIPMGWKRAVVTVAALLILGIGWVLRIMNQRKKERALRKAQEITSHMDDELNAVADSIAHNVVDRVETEIDMIQEDSK